MTAVQHADTLETLAEHTDAQAGPFATTRSVQLISPAELRAELPVTRRAAAVVDRGRAEIRAVLNGLDNRLMVIVGPCSIHDTEAGLDYAARLAAEASRHRDDLLVVMRTYFEKPRTTVGWKGLINDPHLDGSHDVDTGLRAAREFLLQVNGLGLPAATEFLEPVSPNYVADLVSWGAIGARTTESQVHRQLGSALPLPVGFKNGTDGGLQTALDACRSASSGQSFTGIDDHGRAAVLASPGNPDTHLILRGGSCGPNYAAHHVRLAADRLRHAGLNPRVIVDASHANSGKCHIRQALVAGELARQLEDAAPEANLVAGIMLESFIVEGAQSLPGSGGAPLVRGQSITDACMGWEATAVVLARLAEASRRRRTSSAG